MEHQFAQRRILICAAFFSFGALSGAMTGLKLTEAALVRFAERISSFLSLRPLLLVPASFALGPLMMLVLGVSAFGSAMVNGILSLVGFAAGFIFTGAVRCGCPFLISLGFLLLYTLGVIVIGSGVKRMSNQLRFQVRSGGIACPDYAYDLARVWSSFALLLLAALALAYYRLD